MKQAFGRLTDLESFYKDILEYIPTTNGRLASVIARLGWLNLMHPKHLLVRFGQSERYPYSQEE